MTVSELISMLSTYPADTRVTLLNPDRRWLLPIEVKLLPADQSSCSIDFVAITSADDCDEIEGLVIPLSRGDAPVASATIARLVPR